MSALIVFPNNPLVASAAAQVVGLGESAAAPGSAAGAAAEAGKSGLATSAPVPLALTAAAFAAPLTAAAPIGIPAILSAAPAAPAAPGSEAMNAEAFSNSIAPEKKTWSAAIRSSFSRLARLSSTPKKEDATNSAMFDGEKPLDPDSVKIFIVQHGRAPVATTLSSLDATLKENPEAARSLNKKGVVRLVLGDRSADQLVASMEFKAKYPTALGISETSPLKQAWAGFVGNPLLKLVTLPFGLLYRVIRPGAKERTPAAPKSWPTLSDALALPGRAIAEVRFLGRTLRDSFTIPLTSEVAGGIATKGFPFATSIGVYWRVVGLSHPLAMIGLMMLSLSQETFHGIFLNTWNNFQESLRRLRGFTYQMYFNLIYIQGFGAMSRALSWSADRSKTPPWSPLYWKDVMVTSLVGAFFGTLGYNGLNSLYTKGRVKRWQRSVIQQLRDVLFLIAGPFFATGAMPVFWAFFIFQQALDLTIGLIDSRARTRTILYAVAAGDAAGKDPERLTSLLKERGVTARTETEKLALGPAKPEAAR